MGDRIVKVGKRGEVVIPKEIRDTLDIRAGSYVIISRKRGSIILRKLETRRPEKSVMEILKSINLSEREFKKLWQLALTEREKR